VKKGIGIVVIFLIVISLVLVSCGSSKTTTTTTTTTSIQPVQVTAVSGPLQPINPGGPTIQITLQNITALGVTSLSAVFTNLGPRDYKFDFPVSDDSPLRPMASTSATQTLINGSFNNDVSYPLTLEGTLQGGLKFNYTVHVKIAALSN
jgi:hypothetical protein